MSATERTTTSGPGASAAPRPGRHAAEPAERTTPYEDGPANRPAEAGDPGARPVLSVEDLSVDYSLRGSRESRRALHGVSLSVAHGGMTAVVGESGSGKSTTASAVIGMLAGNASVASGSVLLGERQLLGAGEAELQRVRGAHVGYIPQDPGNSLNPLKTVGANVAEALRIHRRVGRPETRERVLELLERVGLDRPRLRAGQFPHELSGGMRQRVLIASAIALSPELIIADEPTSALDVTVQQKILDLLDDLRREEGTSILFITHDLAVAGERADRVAVMQSGRVVEDAPASRIFSDPQCDYTRRLLRDAPSLRVVTEEESGRGAGGERRPAEDDRPTGGEAATSGGRTGLPWGGTGAAGPDAAPLLSVQGLSKVYARHSREEDDRRPDEASTSAEASDTAERRDDVIGVEDVSFDVAEGTTHGVVGESGSGKTTLGKALAGLIAPDAGTALVAGYDVARLGRHERRDFRRTVQLVHQNPHTAIDPKFSIEAAIAEPLANFKVGTREERRARVAEVMEQVALPPELAARRPRELSGGQLQRVAIARALVIEPRLVVLDEAVSALDVTVQAQILRLLERLQRELGLTYLFISHDLAVVRQIADTVSVVSRGHQVEAGPARQIFEDPRDPYTRRLLAAIPRPARTASGASSSSAIRN
ncbi:dipeptide ABC transporter ATP-binding protein [Rothia halotolerans]|uniref:dipeptide ABC transporter ATP-binding protein n=1 Tax=Rothia halotolerans TaxID=405770 RepID=UPI00101C17F1|nr:ABC transporter ATP-binding protein [Rothia halotolerans]